HAAPGRPSVAGPAADRPGRPASALVAGGGGDGGAPGPPRPDLLLSVDAQAGARGGACPGRRARLRPRRLPPPLGWMADRQPGRAPAGGPLCARPLSPGGDEKGFLSSVSLSARPAPGGAPGDGALCSRRGFSLRLGSGPGAGTLSKEVSSRL